MLVSVNPLPVRGFLIFSKLFLSTDCFIDYFYITFETMKQNEITTHLQEKVQFLKHACANCHPSMKKYYQGELKKWNDIIQKATK